MNEQTTQSVEMLAQKLGIATEYLWSVLVKQASFGAIIDLIYFVLVIVVGVLLWKLHVYFSKERGASKRSIYYIHEENVIVPMATAVLVWIGFFIACIFLIDDIIIGFLHPEYWAIREIMGVL